MGVAALMTEASPACLTCGGPLPGRRRDGRPRQYCSRPCVGRALAVIRGSATTCPVCGHHKSSTAHSVACRGVDRGRGRWEFPYAHLARYADVPALCPRCGGASLYRVVEGMACRVCPGRLLVAEALHALVRRGCLP